MIIMDPTTISVNPTKSKWSGVLPAAWVNYERAREIKSYYTAVNDVAEFMQANPEVNYRYYI